MVSDSSAGSLCVRACAALRWAAETGGGFFVLWFFLYFLFLSFFFPLLALVSLADVAAGGGKGSTVIAWDLGAFLSSPFRSRSSAAVAKDFCNYRLKYNFDGK